MDIIETVGHLVALTKELNSATTIKRGRSTRGSAGAQYLQFLTGDGDIELRALIEEREEEAMGNAAAADQYRKLSVALIRVLRNFGLVEPAPTRNRKPSTK
jgi:hypothetical protein